MYLYLHNWLVQDHSCKQVEKSTHGILHLFHCLGLEVNKDKLISTPLEKIKLIWVVLDSTLARVFLPLTKFLAIRDLCMSFKGHPQISVRNCLRLLGHMAAHTYMIPPCEAVLVEVYRHGLGQCTILRCTTWIDTCISQTRSYFHWVNRCIRITLAIESPSFWLSFCDFGNGCLRYTIGSISRRLQAQSFDPVTKSEMHSNIVELQVHVLPHTNGAGLSKYLLTTQQHCSVSTRREVPHQTVCARRWSAFGTSVYEML